MGGLSAVPGAVFTGHADLCGAVSNNVNRMNEARDHTLSSFRHCGMCVEKGRTRMVDGRVNTANNMIEPLGLGG